MPSGRPEKRRKAGRQASPGIIPASLRVLTAFVSAWLSLPWRPLLVVLLPANLVPVRPYGDDGDLGRSSTLVIYVEQQEMHSIDDAQRKDRSKISGPASRRQVCSGHLERIRAIVSVISQAGQERVSEKAEYREMTVTSPAGSITRRRVDSRGRIA